MTCDVAIWGMPYWTFLTDGYLIGTQEEIVMKWSTINHVGPKSTLLHFTLPVWRAKSKKETSTLQCLGISADISAIVRKAKE